MFSTDIDLLKTKIEFNKYLDDRIEIINKIKKDNIKGTIKLTEKNCHTLVQHLLFLSILY